MNFVQNEGNKKQMRFKENLKEKTISKNYGKFIVAVTQSLYFWALEQLTRNLFFLPKSPAYLLKLYRNLKNIFFFLNIIQNQCLVNQCEQSSSYELKIVQPIDMQSQHDEKL